jgi:tetratricopeptide (TPR) repeat protein
MRRQLNVKLLVGLLAGLAAAAVGLHLVHQLQVTRNAGALLAQADRARGEGQLRQAADYYQRYLDSNSTDTDARLNYALTLEKLAEPELALKELQTGLRRDPARDDLRRAAVRLATQLDLFEDAARDLALLSRSARDNAEKAQVEHLLAWCQQRLGEFGKAAESYRRALKANPKQLLSYQHLADLLRGPLERPRQAAEVLDQMVAANPGSSAAYLIRARFRKEQGTTDAAWEDVSRAGELAPGHTDVLLVSAELAQAQGKGADAYRQIERGLEKHPEDARLYQMLAWLSRSTGTQEEAIRCLRRGLEKRPGADELLLSLADLLADAGDAKEAEATVARLRQRKTQPAAVVDGIEARLLARQGRWLEALRLLQRARPQLPARSPWRAQADLLLGWCYQRLGDSDQALAAFGRVLAFDPGLPAARLGLGTTLLEAGRVTEALTELRAAAAADEVPAGTWPVLARALLQANLGLPPARRDWQELEAALTHADEDKPGAAEVVVLRAEMLTARGQATEAAELLKKAREKEPGAAVLWAAAADLAARGGDLDRARDLLTGAEGKVTDPLPLRLAWVRYWHRRGGGPAREGLARLARESTSLSAADRVRLLRALAEAQYHLGDVAAAERLWRELADRDPTDLLSRSRLFDLALQAGKADTARRLLAELRRIEGKNGALGHYAEAALGLARARAGDAKALPLARKHLAALERRQMYGARVSLLKAAAAEVEGDAESASQLYAEALERGENDPRVVERLVQLLCARQAYDRADEVLRKAEERGPLGKELARLGAEVALKLGEPTRAAGLAREAVPADARDYREHLWLARLLDGAGLPAEAEAVLRRTVKSDGVVPDVWEALITHLARTGQKDRAAAVLAQMRRELPPVRLSLSLARCHEALGQRDQAEALYREALKERPDDFLAREATAAFYLRSGRPTRAEPLLRQLLDPAAGVPAEVAARARRELAILLAGRGGSGSHAEALALLDRNTKVFGPTVEDDRARAAVWATRPAQQRKALQLLERSLDRKPLAPQEQFLLARLHEAQGDLARANDLISGLLTVDPGNPDYLAYHVGTLIRRGDLDEARAYLDRLERAEPHSRRTRDLTNALRKARGRLAS